MIKRARNLVFIFLMMHSAMVSDAAEKKPPDLWPSYRHDGTLAGQTSLKGGLEQAPTERWAVDLGGNMASAEQVRLEDVNGDGHLELLRILPDRIICQDLSGKKLWEVDGLTHPNVTEIRDWTGDGGRGLLVSEYTSLKSTSYMINGRNGRKALLFSSENTFGATSRSGHLLPGVAGAQYAYWWSTGDYAEGYVWSFENGPDKPTVRFKAQEKGVIYAPLFMLADVDRDGKTEMVMISHEQFWIYDLATSRRKSYIDLHNQIRSYYSIDAAIPLKKGAPATMLMINPHMPGVKAVALDDRQTSHLLWKQIVGGQEGQYQPDIGIYGGAPDPFMDIDGDGSIEIMTSIDNEHHDGKRWLVIFRADDGKRLFEAPDLKVLSVDDLDGDGIPEVLLKEGDTLRIANFKDGKFVDRWSMKSAEPLLKPLPAEFDLTRVTGTRGDVDGRGNTPLWREDEKSPTHFLLKFADGTYSCMLEKGGSLKKIKAITQHAALGNLPAPKSPDQYSWNGSKLTFTQNGRSSVTFQMPMQRMYQAAPPLVGDLDGQVRIVVRNFADELISLAPDGSDPCVLVRKIPNGATREFFGQICDVDGDGKNELLTSSYEYGGGIVAVDGAGKVKLHIPPIEGATEWELGPTSGKMGPAPTDGRWIAIRFRKKFVPPAVAAYDGKTGRQMWVRPSHPTGRNEKNGFFFALHVPTAVYDYNGDGADDLLAESENTYGIIDVKNNKDLVLVPCITLAAGHWAAYATPIVAHILGTATPQILRCRAYALMEVVSLEGIPVWHYGLTRDTTPRSLAGLADLDGDGKIEPVVAQVDGKLLAWDAGPLDPPQKCPSCPPEAPLTNLKAPKGEGTEALTNNYSGSQRWTYQLEPPVSDLTAMDLDGDGKGELLCGAGDGKLHALKEVGGKCTELWSLDLGRRVGAPIAADLDGDGKAEILAPTEDGKLHCLGAK